MKISNYSDEYLRKNFSDVVFMEGHFESYRYFDDFKSEILKEFNFKMQII